MHDNLSKHRGEPRRSRFVPVFVLALSIASQAIFFAANPRITTHAGFAPGVYAPPGEYGLSVSQQPSSLPRRLAFTHITTREGLSSDQGWATVQDNAGFIWIGTINGLNRYDGSAITIYQHKGDDPTSLSNNFVRTLFVDNTGKLWVGTNSGLSAYDSATDSFTVYRHDDADPTSLSAGTVLAISQDHSGTLWVGTDGGGLNKFDPATGEFTVYSHDPKDPNSLRNDSVRSIYQDQDGNLWVGTYGGGLNRFDQASGRFSAYRHDPADPQSISSDLVTRVVQDTGGDLWVGTWGGGLNRFDPATGNFSAYRHDPADPASLGDDIVVTLCMDSYGALWVGTYSGGLSRFDAASGTFTSNATDAGDGESLSGNRVRDLYEDRSGLMWVTTEGGGVNLYNPQQRAFTVYSNSWNDPDSLSANAVYSVYQDDTGMVWVGMEAGLDRLDLATGNVRHYPRDPKNPQEPGFPTIFGVTGDGKDGLWIATYGVGLYHLDPATGVFTAYRHDVSNPDSLMDDSINGIARDRAGALWLPTTTGLARFDPGTGAFKAYRNEQGNPRSITPGEMTTVLVADDRTIWTSGPSGLNHLDPASGEVTRYQHDPADLSSLSDNFIFKLYQDAAGTVWAAGFDGVLNRFNPQTGGFAHFLQDNPGPAQNIGAVLDEMINGQPTGNLWIWRNHSLVKFDPRTGQYRIYTTSDGLPTVQATRGASVGNKGELLLGSTRGLIVADPAQVRFDTEPPQVAFTDFLLANSQVPIGASSVLTQSINQTDRIELSYEDRIISFGFAALSFRGPVQARYKYMLQGFEPGWNEVDSTRRVATYTNLPGGNYVFRVTASNADGVWNEVGRSITLVVVPPWWETQWFRASAILAMLVLIALVFWLRVNGLHKRQRALEQGISQRTAALETEIGVRRGAEAALQKRNEELVALNEMAQTLTEWTNLNRALQGVGTTLSSLFGGAGVTIWALDDERRVLTRLLEASHDEVISDSRTVSLEDDPVSAEVVDRLQLKVLDGAEHLPLIATAPNLDRNLAAGELMLVPLQSRGDAVGLLCIRASTPEQRFSKENILLADTTASTLANALENARLVTAERTAAAEEERANIARELHDSVSQALYAASLTADVLADYWETNPAVGRRATAAVREFTRAAAAQMRTLLVELRPAALINTPLTELLDTLTVALVPSQALTVEAILAPAPLMPAEVQVAYYRIAQETLNNVVKHAHAQHARIVLQLAPPLVVQEGSESWCGTLSLRIADDGRGFEASQVSSGRLGLASMHERVAAIGATLKVFSMPGEGTQVEVHWTGCARPREEAT